MHKTSIATLPDALRETLVLRDVQGFSYGKIAEVTGAPIGTVMSASQGPQQTHRDYAEGRDTRASCTLVTSYSLIIRDRVVIGFPSPRKAPREAP